MALLRELLLYSEALFCSPLASRDLANGGWQVLFYGISGKKGRVLAHRCGAKNFPTQGLTLPTG